MRLILERLVTVLIVLLLSLTTLAPSMLGLPADSPPLDAVVTAAIDKDHDDPAHQHGHRHNHPGCNATFAGLPAEYATIHFVVAVPHNPASLTRRTDPPPSPAYRPPIV